MPAKLLRKSPTQIAATFDLDDPREKFMLEVLHRLHTEIPGLYRLHAVRRTVHHADGKACRRVLTVTSFHPRRRGAPPEWNMIVWDIDAVSIQFKRCGNRAAARAAFAAA